MAKSKNKLKVIPLGGLHEIGKNMTLFQYSNDIIIVDCGMAFPDDEHYGIDLVIPDMTFLERNKDKIRGIVLTHGHEDHIGSIPYALKQFNVPIYGTRLTLGILKRKLEEHGLENDTELIDIEAGDEIKLGCFSVEFIRTNHSIADSVALAIKSPIGTVIHTGDFKIDYTPICGKPIDLTRFAELGRKGVLLLMSDSTNAERKGYTESERVIRQTFRNMFTNAHGRILVATFASNIHRIQQVFDMASEFGRKVCICGRSMENVIGVAAELGYMDIGDNVLIDVDMINNYPEDKLVILTTGSQGEPMSALTRISSGEHRKVKLMPDDLVIISANAIPGNEKLVNNVINSLLEKGAKVKYNAEADIHVSGHACSEELKLMLMLTNPKYFMPVHGEYKHLEAHSHLAQEMGIAKENIFILENGQILEVRDGMTQISGNVQAGEVLVDGTGVGDVGNVVLKDRKSLAEEGLIVVAITVDGGSGQVISGPNVISRGFVYEKESEDILEYVRDVVIDACDTVDPSRRDLNLYRNAIREAVKSCIFEMCRRRPMILPIVLEL